MTIRDDPRAQLRERIDQCLTGVAGGDAEPCFFGLAADFEAVAQPIRQALLASPLAWSEAERRDAGWLHRACDDLAAIGHRLALHAAPRLQQGDRDTREMLAIALFYMGEAVKWDVSVARGAPHDMRKTHALMVIAMERGRQREAMAMPVAGRYLDCTIEALYWRVLLLARFASGVLNAKQMEILDAWMWMWMPVLAGMEEVPQGTSLRADLDSASGLQQGPREDEGPSLYLPREPIEAAYQHVVAQFQSGRMVPAEGIASEFRIEEHVAVLALLRHGLRQSRRDSMQRAIRHRVDRPVELFVGLAEIMHRGFAPAAPTAPLTLAAVDDKATSRMRIERDHDTAMGELYGAERRMVRLLDESETGLGLEGAGADLDGIAAGDLVAMRLWPNEPVVLGKVVRSVASKTPGHTVIGVRRLSGAARPVEARRETETRAGAPATLVYVAGGDTSGRQDGMLVAERDFADRAPLTVSVGDWNYRLRLNRARERGRGWVLAGFEVASARPSWEIEIA